MNSPTDYQFHRVATLDELAPNSRLEISIDGWNILVCRYENKIYAVENRCSHQDKKFTGGRIRRGQIICPVHGARFNLADGAACSPPATRPLVTFPLRELNGALEVATPVRHPDAERPATNEPL